MALALMFVAVPSFAVAKDKAKAPTPVATATPAPKGNPVFIDYNLADDPENILYLDLSTGKRVAIRLM
ncbi:MAG TPA: peptidylprolyl isomerase, partial [Sphingomonas sp.]